MNNIYFKNLVKILKVTFIISLFFISGSCISKAATFYFTYRDGGCSPPLYPGGAPGDCYYGGGQIGGGCPPGDWYGACSGRNTISFGQPNVLTISHTVTFQTDKNKYNIGETAIPYFDSTNFSVNCPAKYALSFPPNINLLDIVLSDNYVSENALFLKNFSSLVPFSVSKSEVDNYMNSFEQKYGTSSRSLFEYLGLNLVLRSMMTKNPIAYTNDCNAAGNINISNRIETPVNIIIPAFSNIAPSILVK